MHSVPKTLRLRPDLVCRRIQMGREWFWVLKDPLSRAYHYVTDREFTILNLLDGERDLRKVIAYCSKHFAPEFVSADSILKFLHDAKARHLLKASAGAPHITDRSSYLADRNSQKGFLANPLAIRLPGINPNRFLPTVVATTEKIRSILRLSILVFLPVVICAIAIIIVHFERFSDHVVVAVNREGSAWWWMFFITIALTKIIHELAHALACKQLGGECREIGVMLLVGVPCLYCDVSDSWMMPNRWHRILIAAAGMLAEIVIAAGAVFVWLQTDPGVIRDLCVTVVLVCSVTTVVFNGNPLLRYDGYFILSDLIGIPNLSGLSRALLLDRCRRLLWRLPQPNASNESTLSIRPSWLVGYAIASAVYRFAILILIAFAIHQYLQGSGLEILAWLLLVGVASVLMFRAIKPLVKPPDRRLLRSASGRTRIRSLGWILALLALTTLCVPLPKMVSGPAMIQVVDASDVYVVTPGNLESVSDYGRIVKEGEILASLQSTEAELQFSKLQVREETLRAELGVLKLSTPASPNAASMIKSIEEQLASIEHQKKLSREELSKLQIRSPKDGKFFPPRYRSSNHPSKSESDMNDTWHGAPLAKRNLGCRLDRGVLVGTIGKPDERDVSIFISQQDVGLIAKGQEVFVCIDSVSSAAVKGRVVELSTLPANELPPEITLLLSLIEPVLNMNTRYRVQVKLDGNIELPIRMTGLAKIRVSPSSILRRVQRSLMAALRI